MSDAFRIPEPADLLNHGCACRFTDASALDTVLGEGQDEAFASAVHAAAPHLFASQPVFVTDAERASMAAVVKAVERVTALASYRARALEGAAALAHVDHGERGVLFGYDFHLGVDGPKLIEINTNAGGILLALALARAQVPCCEAVDHAFAIPSALDALPDALCAMFVSEHGRVFGDRPLTHVAIVDESPETQFLAPEFTLFARLFASHGIRASILAPEALTFAEGRLRAPDRSPIDLVYNRLTDFTFADSRLAPIVEAYEARAIALTPNPRAHALFADKARLVLLSDRDALLSLGASAEDAALLAHAIPTTRHVQGPDAAKWWADRKSWFFKPRDGYGSRAAYRGDKLTKRVWEEIVAGDVAYVAQRIVPPRERLVHFADDASEHVLLKYDVRNYTFEGDVLLLAARLYQGQTTNFRTEGGGFAAVFSER